jgi:hypothetical protein
VATCFALVFFFKINKYNCNFLKQGNHGLKKKKKKLCYAMLYRLPILFLKLRYAFFFIKKKKKRKLKRNSLSLFVS